MILPYSQTLNGQPTYFVEKITQGLYTNPETKKLMQAYQWPKKDNWSYQWSCRNDFKDKLHTIRKDEKNRWHAGRLIHFVINNRSKNQWQFAPVIPCISTQKIEMVWRNGVFLVYVDSKLLNNKQTLHLALNDGFESEEELRSYFNTDFTGKIIHWTNLKY